MRPSIESKVDELIDDMIKQGAPCGACRALQLALHGATFPCLSYTLTNHFTLPLWLPTLLHC
jgi:hypothetical protein